MTTITVTFMVDFIAEDEIKTPKSSKKKNKKPKSLFEEKMSTTTINTENMEKTPFDNNLQTSIHVAKPKKYLHIEYEILPKIYYYVDVVLWGTIAKIFTKEGAKALTPIVKLKHSWVTFSIEHKFMLKNHDLINLKAHILSFTIRPDKNAVSSNAAAQEDCTFYFLNEDIEFKSIFAEAFEINPNILTTNEEEKSKNVVKFILQELLYFNSKAELINIVKIIPDIIYRKKILYIINKLMCNKLYKCFNTFDTPGVDVDELLASKPPTERKKIQKKEFKSKSSIKSKTNKETNIFQLNLPGEVLFTDPNMTVFDFKKSTKDMKSVLVIINVENLMSSIQKDDLKPLVIKLERIMNIPVPILNKNRFDYLYLTYKLCDIIYKTEGRPIDDNVYFKHHRAFFLEEKHKLLAYQVQDGFLVQIHGLRKTAKTDKPEIFGTNAKDKYFSKLMTNKKDILKYSTMGNTGVNESVLIAVACFKLNMLLCPFYRFSETEYCIHPSRCPISLNENNESLDRIIINSINVDQIKSDPNPITGQMLLTNGTCVKIKMELQSPLNKIMNDIKIEGNFYNRIILIIRFKALAKYVLSNVITHNSCWLYKEDIVPPNYLNNNETSRIDINNVEIITGFSIDNGDVFIMFLEGNSKWIKKVLWRPIQNENFTCAKIFYNSDDVFKERVYTNSIPNGGVYTVTLHSSLKSLLDCSKIFSSGYLPEPCRRAYEKLDLILKSNCLKEITINMLPTIKELISLDIEWGVPVHWPIEEE